jgi:hypothetical protein
MSPKRSRGLAEAMHQSDRAGRRDGTLAPRGSERAADPLGAAEITRERERVPCSGSTKAQAGRARCARGNRDRADRAPASGAKASAERLAP